MNQNMNVNIFMRISGIIYIVFLLLFFSCTGKKQHEQEWIPLLDKDLSKWETYLSYEMKNGYDGTAPVDANGDTIRPIGYNNNYKNVFTIITEDNTPVLKISGELYGCLFTKESYKNYHLKLKMRWGNKKWEPRLNEPFDSGLLYHSQGECGSDYWRTWMMSHEFQLIENGCGDYWCIGDTRMDVKARQNSGKFIFDKQKPVVSIGAGTVNGNYCSIDKANEKPNGEWNQIELICYEDKSLHIVNGEVVMALSNLSYKDGEDIKPLVEGQIQLQSEAAEVFFKDIEIKFIDQLPAKLQF